MALQKQGNKKRLAGGRQPASEAVAGGLSVSAAGYEDALAEFREEEDPIDESAPASEFIAAVAESDPEPAPEAVFKAAEAAIAPAPFFEAVIAPAPVFAPTPVFEAEPEVERQAEPAPVVLATKVVVGESIEAKVVVSSADGAAASAAAWGSAWPGKSVEVWNENAAAVVDLASKLAKAKSLTEIVTLQARFANERLESFMRLSSELAVFPKFFFFAA